jgi:hypothetical protein
MAVFLEVDPRTLHLPSGRASGADPVKLARQIARYGSSIAGMPPIWVTRGKDGALIINNGATRAIRVAKLLPGQTVTVEVIDDLPDWDLSPFPTVGDRIP